MYARKLYRELRKVHSEKNMCATICREAVFPQDVRRQRRMRMRTEGRGCAGKDIRRWGESVGGCGSAKAFRPMCKAVSNGRSRRPVDSACLSPREVSGCKSTTFFLLTKGFWADYQHFNIFRAAFLLFLQLHFTIFAFFVRRLFFVNYCCLSLVFFSFPMQFFARCAMRRNRYTGVSKLPA